MKNKSLYISLFILTAGLVIHSPAVALTPDQIAQQQQIVLQQQEQSRQAEENRRELREAERIYKSRESTGVFQDKDTSDLGGNKKSDCPRFSKIIVMGNTIYSQKRIHQITDSYLGFCITRDRMNVLQNDLMALYINNKYTLARVYFDQNRSKLTRSDSDVVFIIEEGKVNKVEMRDEFQDKPSTSDELSDWQKFRLKTKVFTAVPGVIGQVFNLKDFEQGLDQINRLQSNNATIDIKPTSGLDAAGYSDIFIINKHPDRRTTFFGMGLDNSGNKNVGENNFNINLNQDNLLALNDNLYIKYTTDTDFDRGNHYSQSIYSAVSIPFGYWTWNTSLSWSDYLTTVDGLHTSFHTNGSTVTQTHSIDRVLYRSAKYRAQLGTALQIRDTENWIRDIKSVTGSRKSSNMNIFWNNTIYHKFGTLIIKPSYEKGLDLFGSREDPKDVYVTEPHLQYDMLKLYMYSGMNFNTVVPITWNFTFDGQYSFQNLYGVDQQSLGSEWTVRGFKDSAISGDDGFYVRNDISMPIWSLLPDIITDKKFMQSGGTWSVNNSLGRTQIVFFGDYGYVRNRHKVLPDPYDSNKGVMAGAGSGLIYKGKNLTWSLTYARALKSPEYLQTRDAVPKEEQSVYWRISANY